MEARRKFTLAFDLMAIKKTLISTQFKYNMERDAKHAQRYFIRHFCHKLQNWRV
jgi:hypothetical protein